MCFVHSGSADGSWLVQQTVLGPAAALAFASVGPGGGAGGPVDVPGSGTTDAAAGPRAEQVLDGYSRVLHNRWNRDLPPAATVRPGEVIQLLCRDALDIGETSRTMTPDGSVTIDLGRIHPLTGPVEVIGAEPDGAELRVGIRYPGGLPSMRMSPADAGRPVVASRLREPYYDKSVKRE